MSLHYSSGSTKSNTEQLYYSNGTNKLPLSSLYYSDGSSKNLVWDKNNSGDYSIILYASTRNKNCEIYAINPNTWEMTFISEPGDLGNVIMKDYWGGLYFGDNTSGSSTSDWHTYGITYDSKSSEKYFGKWFNPDYHYLEINPVSRKIFRVGFPAARKYFSYDVYSPTNTNPQSYTLSTPRTITTDIYYDRIKPLNESISKVLIPVFNSNTGYFLSRGNTNNNVYLWAFDFGSYATTGTVVSYLTNQYESTTSHFLFPSTNKMNSSTLFWATYALNTFYINLEPLNAQVVKIDNVKGIPKYLGISVDDKEAFFSIFIGNDPVKIMVFNLSDYSVKYINVKNTFIIPQVSSSSNGIVNFIINSTYTDPKVDPNLYDITISKYINTTLIDEHTFTSVGLVTYAHPDYSINYYNYYNN